MNPYNPWAIVFVSYVMFAFVVASFGVVSEFRARRSIYFSKQMPYTFCMVIGVMWFPFILMIAYRQIKDWYVKTRDT